MANTTWPTQLHVALFSIHPLASCWGKPTCPHFLRVKLTASFAQCDLQLRSLSHGTVDAGVARYLRASGASLSWAPAWDDHHCKGQSSILVVGSALYLCMALSGCTSSSDSESEPICRRRFIFFLGGPSSVCGDLLGGERSMPPSVVHTSSVCFGQAL